MCSGWLLFDTNKILFGASKLWLVEIPKSNY